MNFDFDSPLIDYEGRPTDAYFNQLPALVAAEVQVAAGPTPAQIADAVWANATGAAVAIRLAEAWGRLGLDASKPLVTGETSITFGDIVMALSEAGNAVTVVRQ